MHSLETERRGQVREVSVVSLPGAKTKSAPAQFSLFQTESPRTTQLISTGGKKEAGFPFLDTGPATTVSAPHNKSPAAVPVSYLSYSHLWKGTQSIQGLCEKRFLIKKKTKTKNISFQVADSQESLSWFFRSTWWLELIQNSCSKQIAWCRYFLVPCLAWNVICAHQGSCSSPQVLWSLTKRSNTWLRPSLPTYYVSGSLKVLSYVL